MTSLAALMAHHLSALTSQAAGIPGGRETNSLYTSSADCQQFRERTIEQTQAMTNASPCRGRGTRVTANEAQVADSPV